MTKLLIILMAALVLESIGVVFLNKGLRQVGDMPKVSLVEVGRLVARGATNTNLLLGVFFEALFFVGLLILLSRSNVSFIWPLTSLGFVLTTLAAKFILGEEVTATRWSGVFLIMVGATLITWSENAKPPNSPAATPQTAAAK